MERTVAISKAMIEYYLSGVTDNWFGDHNVLPADVQEYLPLVKNIEVWADYRGELKYLKLALEYLLTNPEINYEKYAGCCYPYSEEEM